MCCLLLLCFAHPHTHIHILQSADLEATSDSASSALVHMKALASDVFARGFGYLYPTWQLRTQFLHDLLKHYLQNPTQNVTFATFLDRTLQVLASPKTSLAVSQNHSAQTLAPRISRLLLRIGAGDGAAVIDRSASNPSAQALVVRELLEVLELHAQPVLQAPTQFAASNTEMPALLPVRSFAASDLLAS
jgi:hypothetical protein